MSRIGKKPVSIDGVTVTQTGNTIKIKGKLGELERNFHSNMKIEVKKEEIVVAENNLTTFDVRYLIALTNPKTDVIEGIILTPGEKLGEIFTYVSDVSYKCQRSIPMSFFNSYEGKCVYNP